jgi:hypothetical protein
METTATTMTEVMIDDAVVHVATSPRLRGTSVAATLQLRTGGAVCPEQGVLALGAGRYLVGAGMRAIQGTGLPVALQVPFAPSVPGPPGVRQLV